MIDPNTIRIGDAIWHIENDMLVKYIVLRVNQKSIFIRTDDFLREFSVPFEELEDDRIIDGWYSDRDACIHERLVWIDEELDRLMRPVKILRKIRRRFKNILR